VEMNDEGKALRASGEGGDAIERKMRIDEVGLICSGSNAPFQARETPHQWCIGTFGHEDTGWCIGHGSEDAGPRCDTFMAKGLVQLRDIAPEPTGDVGLPLHPEEKRTWYVAKRRAHEKVSEWSGRHSAPRI